MLPLRATPVVGLPQYEGWSQVSENPPTSFARLVCAFSVRGEQAGNVGRDVAAMITEKTLASGQELYGFLNELAARVEAENCQFSCAAYMATKTSAVLGALRGAILLKRSHKVGQVLKAADQLRIIEGQHRPDDTCVLFTQQALSFASEIEQKLLQGYDTDSIITSVVPSIHAQHDSSLCAIAFVSEVTGEEKFSEMTLSIDLGENAGGEAAQTVHERREDEMQKAEVGSTRQEMADAEKVGLTASVGSRDWKGALRSSAHKVSQLLGRLASIRPHLRSPFASSSAYIPVVRKPSKVRLIALAVLILALIAGFVVWKVQAYQRRVRSAQQTVEPFYQLITQARESVKNDPLPTRQKVADAVAQLDQLAAGAQNDTAALPEIERAREAVLALQEEISGKDEVSDLPVFYDLRLVSSDFVASRVDGWEESLVADDGTAQPPNGDPSEGQARAAFLDTQQRKLIVLDLATKKVQLIDVASAGEAQDVRLIQRRAVLLADGLQSVVLSGGTTDDSQPKVVVEQGDSNRSAALLGAFKVYLYVFNPDKRNIYRYSEQDGGSSYSEPIGWLQSTLGVAFEDVNSMAVDGDVWLTTKAGEIRRYTKGVAVPFQVEGLPEPLSTPIQLATSPGSEYIYVLEPAKNRVILIQKSDGVFVREIKSSSLASATALFVSERLKKAFAVSGSIVFEVGI